MKTLERECPKIPATKRSEECRTIKYCPAVDSLLRYGFERTQLSPGYSPVKTYFDINLNSILKVLKARAGTAIISGAEGSTSADSGWREGSFCSTDEDIPRRLVLTFRGNTSIGGCAGMSNTGNGIAYETGFCGILRWTDGMPLEP
jgi:hypothetical protein